MQPSGVKTITEEAKTSLFQPLLKMEITKNGAIFLAIDATHLLCEK